MANKHNSLSHTKCTKLYISLSIGEKQYLIIIKEV